VTAARLVNAHGRIEDFPPDVLGDQRDLALLFKDLATLRAGEELFADADDLRWRGPTESFPDVARTLGDTRLATRARAAVVR
jgi:hypothetical protein